MARSRRDRAADGGHVRDHAEARSRERPVRRPGGRPAGTRGRSRSATSSRAGRRSRLGTNNLRGHLLGLRHRDAHRWGADRRRGPEDPGGRPTTSSSTPGTPSPTASRPCGTGTPPCSRARSSTSTRLLRAPSTGIPDPISETLTNATPLILGGLSVGLAFRAGLFNIGGQGQIIMGAVCAGFVGFHWSLPPGLHLLLGIVAGIIGGAALGRHRRAAQGHDRCPRGDHHDHAQLRRALPAGLPR